MDQPIASGVLLLSMPYASVVPIYHTRKLVEMIAPNCQRLLVLGDGRLDLSGTPQRVCRAARLPSLHRRQDIQPPIWSALLWLAKLGYILARAGWTVWQTRRQVGVIVCFLEVFFTPVILLGRALGKKIIYFEPSNTIVADDTFPARYRWGRLWVSVRQRARTINRRLAQWLVIESVYEIKQGQLAPYLDKVRAISQYVDTQLYHPITPLAERSACIGFIGRLAEIKGIREFLAAIAQLEDARYSFLIIGDGDLRSEVAQALRGPEGARVRWLGWLDEQAIVQRLNEMRLFVLPTAGEGLPNVLLEAMACGTPALASAVGGVPELIEPGITGFLLRDRKPESICQAIQEALKNPDLDLIAQRAREKILADFSLPAATRRWGALLHEAAECA